MKHFYIIGNGFDIFTGFKSKYSDFKNWLQHNYVFVYENLVEAYDFQGEWWNDFEESLAKLNARRFVSKYRPTPLSIDGHLEIVKQKINNINVNQTLVNLCFESDCANRLRGLLDILQFCFEKWIGDLFHHTISARYIELEKEDSFFMVFNYTDTLEVMYKIPADRVLHIHGRFSNHDHLIFGHGKYLFDDESDTDESACWTVLREYNKNPYVYIYRNPQLLSLLKDVEYVHIYGFSFSDVDLDYIDYIYKNVSNNSKWEMSWYSEQDKQRIQLFIRDHFDLKDRSRLIQLEEIAT